MTLAEQVLGGAGVSKDDALRALQAPDDELLAVVDAAYRVRRRFFGRKINLHVIQNAKSGACSEDCAFCSQSAISTADIPRYPLKTAGEIVEGAMEAAKMGAVKYCTVIGGRAPTPEDLRVFCEAFRRIKRECRIHLCVSPGLLTREQARQLKEAGADRINHNLETSRRYFPALCSAHGYDDRLATLKHAREAGLELCCGGLVGAGETLEDRVDLAFSLRELAVHSIPVNFFDPRKGTPLEGLRSIGPLECLKALAMFRLVNPSCDIRAAGGREANLRQMQPLALFIANSIFTRGYLTTAGQGYAADLEMIEAAGFEVAALEY